MNLSRRLSPVLAALCLLQALLLFPTTSFAQTTTMIGADVLHAPNIDERFVPDQDVPYIPSRPEVVEGMLQLAGVSKDDVVYDLGCGDGRIVIAAAKNYGARGVGIDLEPASRHAWMPGIAARVCHPDEARALAGLDECRRNAALLALWVRKEAVLKAAGIGLAVEMECFRSDTDWVRAPSALPAHTHVRRLDVGSDWVAALAATDAWPVAASWLRP